MQGPGDGSDFLILDSDHHFFGVLGVRFGIGIDDESIGGRREDEFLEDIGVIEDVGIHNEGSGV